MTEETQQQIEKIFRKDYAYHTLGVSRIITESDGMTWEDSMVEELQDAFLDFGEEVYELALKAQLERLVSEIKFKDCPHDSRAHCLEEDCRIHDVGGYNEAIRDVLNLINPPSN